MEKKQILIIDDDKLDTEIYKGWLERENKLFSYNVEVTHNLTDGLSVFSTLNLDCVLLDYLIGAENGLDLFDKISGLKDTVPIIFMTGFPEDELELEAIDKGAQFFISKKHINETLLLEKVSTVIGFNENELLAANQAIQEILVRWTLKAS